MDLLLHNNLFERFFKSQNTLSDEKDILIYNIINNPNAKIIFNLDLQNDILNKAKNKKQVIKNFFSKLVHKKRVTKINANPTNGINSIYYESLKKEYNENTSENKFLIHIELNKTEDNSTEISYIDEAINATKKSNDFQHSKYKQKNFYLQEIEKSNNCDLY